MSDSEWQEGFHEGFDEGRLDGFEKSLAKLREKHKRVLRQDHDLYREVKLCVLEEMIDTLSKMLYQCEEMK